MARQSAIAPPPASRGEILEIVETLSAELDDVSAALVETIHENLEELDDDMRTWTLQSTRANLGVMVTLMRDGADPRSVVAPTEALAYAKEYVVRDLDFVLLQRAYRTAQGVFSGMILERLRQATDDADHLADAMSFFNAWIFAWIEAIERQLTDVYMSEREQWVRGAAAMRAAEVRAILRGAPVDAGRGQPPARLRARPLPRRLRGLERDRRGRARRRPRAVRRDGAGRGGGGRVARARARR